MAHIILLEPDSLLAGSLSCYLVNAKHTVSAHSDAQSAVTAADKKRPDLVITELQLAGHSGVEFLYEFRSYPEWQKIPVVVFTAVHPEQTVAYADVLNELGVSTCLDKSTVSLNRLLDELQSLLPAYAKV